MLSPLSSTRSVLSGAVIVMLLAVPGWTGCGRDQHGRVGADSGGVASGTASGAPWTVEGISTWRGRAQAAYTIFFDDTCNSVVQKQFSVVDAELVARKLVANFGAIARDCENNDSWAALATLIVHGHEIASHSYSHPDLTLTADAASSEIDKARQVLSEGLGGYPIQFFIFPYDSFSDPLVEHLRSEGYLGARAGQRGINSARFSDPLRVMFDAFGPGFSMYAGPASVGTPCAGVESLDSYDSVNSDCHSYVLNDYVEKTIASGGWGMRELHSVDGEAWEPVPLPVFQKHLDQVESLASSGTLWVATASEVIRYRFAREHCDIGHVDGSRLEFGTPSAECLRYATELSFEIAAPDGKKLASATQNGRQLQWEQSAPGKYWINADPTLGSVELGVE